MQESLSSTSLASSTCGHGPECKAEGCANAAFPLWLAALDLVLVVKRYVVNCMTTHKHQSPSTAPLVVE